MHDRGHSLSLSQPLLSTISVWLGARHAEGQCASISYRRQLSEMDGIGPVEPDQLVRWNRAAIRQELAGVLEDDDTVAELAPALFGSEGDRTGRVAVRPVGGRTCGLVGAHRWPPAQLAAAMTGRRGPDVALASAATAGWRRILARHRLRVGPMLPTGMPSLALIST